MLLQESNDGKVLFTFQSHLGLISSRGLDKSFPITASLGQVLPLANTLIIRRGRPRR